VGKDLQADTFCNFPLLAVNLPSLGVVPIVGFSVAVKCGAARYSSFKNFKLRTAHKKQEQLVISDGMNQHGLAASKRSLGKGRTNQYSYSEVGGNLFSPVRT
jgi:hypothetical protein